jgi:redox-sensitive bicupin YhaK (pirin superfamily)
MCRHDRGGAGTVARQQGPAQTLRRMRSRLTTAATIDLEQDPVVLPSSAFYRVGENEFGVPGLIAIESVGPFVPVQSVGPFFMIHDSYWQPGFGIGHHPHRTNERLFYIVKGRVEHDDALNGIKGTMDAGDLGRLTEGLRGMFHQEWNGAPGEVSHAFILVYRPDAEPPPAVADFAVLRATDRPVYQEADGVETTELVGSRSPFTVNLSTMRLFADTTFRPGSELPFVLTEGEGVLVYPLEGRVELDEATPSGDTMAAAGLPSPTWGAVRAGADHGNPVTLGAEGSTLPEGPRDVGVAFGRSGGRPMRLITPDGPARIIRVVFASGPDGIVVA